MTDLLHRLVFSYKKAKAIPGKAKKEEQELFILECYRLKQKGKIYFVDYPEHNPVISYGWIKKGEDFEVLTHNSFRYRLNINGAVDIEPLEVITRHSDRVNSSSWIMPPTTAPRRTRSWRRISTLLLSTYLHTRQT